MSSTLTTGSSECVKLATSNEGKRLKLKIPYYYDPRMMKLNTVKDQLRDFGSSVKGSRELLNARLLKLIVDEGSKNFPSEDILDDQQPEKWLLIATKYLDIATSIEPNGETRVAVMTEVNLVLEKLVDAVDELKEIGNNSPTSQHLQSAPNDLFRALLRAGAALMLQPVVEYEMARQCGSSLLIRSSVTIFDMCSGYSGIPEHCTEEYVIANEARRHCRLKRSHALCTNGVDANSVAASNKRKAVSISVPRKDGVVTDVILGGDVFVHG